MPQASFAILKAWISTSSVGRTRSRLFVDWDVEAMVKVGGGCEESTWDGRYEEGPEC
jgi:hypothetical protein